MLPFAPWCLFLFDNCVEIDFSAWFLAVDIIDVITYLLLHGSVQLTVFIFV